MPDFPPLQEPLVEVRKRRIDDGGRVFRGDVRSADWDGGGDLSAGKDATASQGYLIDYSSGSAQFQNVYADGSNIDNIDADNITAGTLDVDRIAVGTITAEKLILGSADNLAQNPGFESGVATPHYFNDGGATGWDVTTGATVRSGAYRATWVASGQTGAAAIHVNGQDSSGMDAHISCADGDVFFFSAWIARGAGTANSCYVRLQFYDETGSTTGTTNGSSAAPGGTFTEYTVEATAPAGSVYVVPKVVVNNDGQTATVVVDDMYCRRKVGQLVIEDQAVDYDRMEDAVWFDTDADSGTASSLTSGSEGTCASFTVSVPSWVGTFHYNMYFMSYMSSAPTVDGYFRSRIYRDTNLLGAVSVTNIETGFSNKSETNINIVRGTIVSPGSSYTFYGKATHFFTGDTLNIFGYLQGIVFGER